MFTLSKITDKKLMNKIRKTGLESMSYLLKHNEYYSFDFDVYLPTKGFNLQRDFVWDLYQKQEFILSILKQIEIPSVSLIAHGDVGQKKIFQVVDGKQRISTFISFLNNEFPINVNGVEYKFIDFDNESRNILERFYFNANIIYSYDDALISDDEKIAFFELCSFSGTPQDVEHLKKLKSK